MKGQLGLLPEVQLRRKVVDMALKLSQGNLEEVADWLERLGCGVEREYEVVRQDLFGSEKKLVQVNVEGLAGTGTGFIQGLDRATAFVILGFALFGMFWPWIIGKGLEEVQEAAD